jgi:hypothetical protein
MITAMTINMYHPMAATVAQAQPVVQDQEKNNTTTTEENA